jgi:aldehyde dehydrogenase (NAD+)
MKTAPAVAAGNTMVFKSSEKSPLGALAFGELVKEAGFPPGVINIVTGGGKVGAMLAGHMDIAKVAFTGSAAAGRQVQIAAAKSNLKHCSLELGGKSPALIFDDADLENALEHNSQGFLLNSGQVCAAASRILVQEGIAPKFVEGLKGAFEKFSSAMGDASSEQVYLGPLADKKQFDRVMGFLEEGKKDGVEVLVGGVRKGEKGQFVEPTVLLNPDGKSKVYNEEIFGPVAVMRTFKTEEEAIEMANDTTYGLGCELQCLNVRHYELTFFLATIFTNDIARALRVAGKIQSGTVSINSSFFPSPATPFGGYKQSGYGRESGRDGLKQYLQAKTIHINMNTSKQG